MGVLANANANKNIRSISSVYVSHVCITMFCVYHVSISISETELVSREPRLTEHVVVYVFPFIQASANNYSITP